MANRQTIVGVHPVYEALASGTRTIQRIHISRGLTEERVRQILDLAKSRDIPVRREIRETLDRLAGGKIHQGVVAVGGVRHYVPFETVLESPDPLLVILDGVADPQNLGSVIRTAEISGASGVIVPERRSAPLSEAVARASAGALEHVQVARVPNLVNAIKMLKEKGIWVVAVDPSGPIEWTEFDYTMAVALVFGGEHRGIRRLVRDNCDAQVRLPMVGKIESLNVSVAAGIVLFEARRQRRMVGA